MAIIGTVADTSYGTEGMAAMARNIVAGGVVLVLMFMVVLAYAQKHDEFCEHGHLLKSFKPCGSMSSDM